MSLGSTDATERKIKEVDSHSFNTFFNFILLGIITIWSQEICTWEPFQIFFMVEIDSFGSVYRREKNRFLCHELPGYA